MARQINDEGLDAIKRFEGLRTTSYADVAGVLTIGYGHTSRAGPPIVVKGMEISAETAEEILRRDLSRFEAAVERLVKVPLSDNQFAALVSFTFNVGEGALAKSTLLRKLNAGNHEAVPSELAKWNRAGGRVVKGLVNRRAAEAGLWARGDFVASQTVEPSAPKPDPSAAIAGGVGAALVALAALVLKLLGIM